MSLIARMALRELRASWRRLLFFFICIAIGVAAIVALRSVIQSVRAVFGAHEPVLGRVPALGSRGEDGRTRKYNAAFVAATSRDPVTRLDAVGLLQLGLGDVKLVQDKPDTYDGFVASQTEDIPTPLRQHVVERLAPAFPSGDADLDRELGRLLAEAHDDFVKDGGRTRAEVDKSMQEAFRRAAELAVWETEMDGLIGTGSWRKVRY